MGSITGLKQGKFTSLDNSGQLRVGQDLNPGTSGQALVSGGRDEPARWDTHTGTIQPLTMGTNLTLTSGSSSFNGGTADTINSTPYTGTVPIAVSAGNAISLDYDEDTLDLDGADLAVQKVPNVLTRGSNISMVVTADGSSATTYDGSEGITITGTDTNTTYQGSSTISINTSTNPDTINCLKVPNNLTAGDGVTMFNTDDGASETTYSGVNPITINVLPPNVFEVSGAKRMTINLSNFMPDDDSSFYNIGVEDDLSSKIHGSLRVLNSAIEVCGFFVIPNGFTATACRIDVTNSSGAAVSRTLTFESFTTYGATGFSSLGTGTTNSEQTFSTTLPAASDKLLLIRINTTTTSDHIRGGYIRLT